MNLNAQIQTKFWGLELSKWYPSLSNAKSIISDRCEYVSLEVNNKLLAMDGSFGGYSWEFATFSFYKGEDWSVLYDVYFSNPYTQYDTAKSRYDSLLESLSDKYGNSYVTKDEFDDVINIWSEDLSDIRCMLRLHRAESKGGENYWYVDLNYYDMNRIEKIVEQQDDEL